MEIFNLDCKTELLATEWAVGLTRREARKLAKESGFKGCFGRHPGTNGWKARIK